MDPTKERYYLSEASAAAGMKVTAVRSWVQRQQLTFGDSDQKSEVAGAAHKIGFDSVVRLAIVAKLTTMFGMSPDRAWLMTKAFSESGKPASGWVGDCSNSISRLPGELFEEGDTYLVIREGATRGEVVNVRAAMTVEEIADLGMVGNFLCVDVGEIYDTVRNMLSDMKRREAATLTARRAAERVEA